MTELLPCPFCGGPAEILTAESMNGGYLFGIMCNDCRSRGDIYDTEAEAIAAWNNRAERVGERKTINKTGDFVTHDSRAERTCRIVKTPSDSDFMDDWRYRCSECGCNIPVNERDPKTGDVINAANYCPNCGARVVSK